MGGVPAFPAWVGKGKKNSETLWGFHGRDAAHERPGVETLVGERVPQ